MQKIRNIATILQFNIKLRNLQRLILGPFVLQNLQNKNFIKIILPNLTAIAKSFAVVTLSKKIRIILHQTHLNSIWLN